jgi:hypothetical protein
VSDQLRPRPNDAPRPGDPRSQGPRPRPRPRDAFWLALTGAIAVVTAAQLVRLAVTVLTDPALEVSGGGLLLAFAITVVWLLTVTWLALGAWRRSVWGCPFDHDADAPEARRCVRHGTVGDPPS